MNCKDCSKDLYTNAGYIICESCKEKVCPECIKPDFKCKSC